jgi:hypothetical protein
MRLAQSKESVDSLVTELRPNPSRVCSVVQREDGTKTVPVIKAQRDPGQQAHLDVRDGVLQLGLDYVLQRVDAAVGGLDG